MKKCLKTILFHFSVHFMDYPDTSLFFRLNLSAAIWHPWWYHSYFVIPLDPLRLWLPQYYKPHRCVQRRVAYWFFRDSIRLAINPPFCYSHSLHPRLDFRSLWFNRLTPRPSLLLPSRNTWRVRRWTPRIPYCLRESSSIDKSCNNWETDKK